MRSIVRCDPDEGQATLALPANVHPTGQVYDLDRTRGGSPSPHPLPVKDGQRVRESDASLTSADRSRRVLMRGDDLVGGAPRDFGHVVELAGEAAGACR